MLGSVRNSIKRRVWPGIRAQVVKSVHLTQNFSATPKTKRSKAVAFEDGDLILIVADREKVVCDTLGALRCHMARKLGLVKKTNTACFG